MADSPTIWILSDGKIGHESPPTGVAAALTDTFEVRHVNPRWPFALLAPFGPADPKDIAPQGSGLLDPPYPDICLASGRRTVPYLRTLKARAPETFCIYFNDPRTKRSGADMLVTMSHDRTRDHLSFVTRTPPHRFSGAVLAAARAAPMPHLAALPEPRAAVLIGGDSHHHSFRPEDVGRLMGHLTRLNDTGVSLMVTFSRRTPIDLQRQLSRLAERPSVALWDGQGPNPMAHYLAFADAVVVTTDSINMVGEATVTGRPVHLFQPSGAHPKVDRFLDQLSQIATLRPLDGTLGGADYPPNDSTGRVASEITNRFQAFRRGELS